MHHLFLFMLFFNLLQENPALALIWVVAIVYAISIHEFFHALAATAQGDYTAKFEGRLSLNPLVHLDPLGTLALLFVGFGWGRPVPFNPYNLRNPRFGPAIVGLAGPFANLLSVVIFTIALRILVQTNGIDLNNLLFLFFITIVQINLILLLFNLVPIPPLDGSKLLYALLPSNLNHVVVFLERYGVLLLIAFLLAGGGLLMSVWGAIYAWILETIIF